MKSKIIENYKNMKTQIEKFYELDEDIRDVLHDAFFKVLEKKDLYNLRNAIEFLTVEGVAPFNHYDANSIEFTILKNICIDEYIYWLDLHNNK